MRPTEAHVVGAPGRVVIEPRVADPTPGWKTPAIITSATATNRRWPKRRRCFVARGVICFSSLRGPGCRGPNRGGGGFGRPQVRYRLVPLSVRVVVNIAVVVPVHPGLDRVADRGPDRTVVLGET